MIRETRMTVRGRGKREREKEENTEEMKGEKLGI